MAMREISFQRDKVYNRRSDLHSKFGGQERGGVSTPRNAPAVFLFTGESGQQYGYSDGPDDSGVFLYTGEGQTGDMTFRGGNAAIRDHARNNKSLFLFEALGKGMGCRFLGEYSCASYDFRTGPDRNGDDRRIIVFHLAPAGEELADTIIVPEEPTGREVPISELRKRAYEALMAPEGQAGEVARRIQYRRRAAVRNYVLARANGKCECCDQLAPFSRTDGTPYLEPHHTTRLSDAGLDHPAYVGAVCPTCHREIHHGQNGDSKNSALATKILGLEI